MIVERGGDIMKRKRIFSISCAMAFFLALIFVSVPEKVKAVFFDQISVDDTKTRISNFMGIDIRSCQILQESDSHGGFLGDGQTFVELQATKVEFHRIVGEMTKEWKDFPLTENLSKAIYGKKTKTEQRMPLLVDEKTENSLIPVIGDGYYYFEDRNELSSDSADDSHLFERNSWNFTLVILDRETYRIYYVEYDT